MNLAHIEAAGGLAGNMLLGAWIDAGVDVNALESSLRSIVPAGWQLATQTVVRRGIRATYAEFAIDADTNERHLAHIELMIHASSLTPQQRERAIAVFRALAQAEADVHGTTIDEIHFHEVGQIDAILDVAATCVAIDLLGIDELTCGELPIGRGRIRMHHGSYPNPPPATAQLLRGLPCYDAGIEGELVTPTGAAIVRTLCSHDAGRAPMVPQRIGYGAGAHDYELPNVTRITIGSRAATQATSTPGTVVVLDANIDDMIPQHFEVALERIFEAGALDAWLTPIIMKKGRPAMQLSAIAPVAVEDAVARAMLHETTTIGVRVRHERRHTLERSIRHVQTPLGPIRVKAVHRGTVVHAAPEYDDLARLARETGRPLSEVATIVTRAIDVELL